MSTSFGTTTEKIETTLEEVGTTESISTETALQFARVPVISDAKCKQYYTGKKISLESEQIISKKNSKCSQSSTNLFNYR